jgi:hypothetical protein
MNKQSVLKISLCTVTTHIIKKLNIQSVSHSLYRISEGVSKDYFDLEILYDIGFISNHCRAMAVPRCTRENK